MINKLNSTPGVAVLKLMQTLWLAAAGSIQTSSCVHVGPEGLPRLMVPEGSKRTLQGGLSGHQQRKNSSWLKQGQITSKIVSCCFQPCGKSLSRQMLSRGKMLQVTWDKLDAVFCPQGAPVCPSKPRSKMGLSTVFHSPGTVYLPAEWSCMMQGTWVFSICFKNLIVFMLSICLCLLEMGKISLSLTPC